MTSYLETAALVLLHYDCLFATLAMVLMPQRVQHVVDTFSPFD